VYIIKYSLPAVIVSTPQPTLTNLGMMCQSDLSHLGLRAPVRRRIRHASEDV